MARKVTVLFLIPSLVAAGAERQLCELVQHMDSEQFEIHVVTFYNSDLLPGPNYTQEIQRLKHVTLHNLAKRRGALGYVSALNHLLRLSRRINPDVLHGYMDGNLPVLAVGLLQGRPSVWGIRSTAGNPGKNTWKASHLQDLSTTLSRWVDLVVYNSEAGKNSFQRIGMRPRRTLVIPNGFDPDRFYPDRAGGMAQRKAWGIPPDVPLLGIVGRLDPVKDHPTFLRAARKVLSVMPDARFVSVGVGASGYSETLKTMAQDLGLGSQFLWAGPSMQMRGVYNALTVLVLSSTHEGFPNVIGEAMACGTPCVATRAGDAGRLIGDPHLVVDPGNDEALASTILKLLEAPPERFAQFGEKARARVLDNFTVEILARTTEKALLEILP